MMLSIMQPYFFPYIGYFQGIKAADKYILYHNISFMKKTWLNRNRILLKNQNVQYVTIPVIQKSSNRLISHIQIDNSSPWKKIILKTLMHNYRNAFYFEQIYPKLSEIINMDFEFLYELNIESIVRLTNHLDINTIIETNNTKYNEVELELLESHHRNGNNRSKQIDKKAERVFKICSIEKADSYINAIGGQELYNKEQFADQGISLSFLKPDKSIEYFQGEHSFVPNLSIIDVLMYNGFDLTKKLLDKFTLV